MAELTLAQFAELTLRLERGELRADVLREVGMTEQQWLEQQMEWLARMAAQLERQRSQLFDRYLAVRATAAQELGAAPPVGTSVRPRIETGGAMNANRSQDKEAMPSPSTGFVKVDPPALYTPAVAAPRAGSADTAAAAQQPTHLSEAYAPPPVVAPAFMPRPAVVAPPASPAVVAPPALVAPPAFVTPPAAVSPPGPVAPPAFVSHPGAVAGPGNVAPPAFVAPPAAANPPGAVAPPAFVAAPATSAPAASAAARPAFASRTSFGTVVRRAHSPAPTVAFAQPTPWSDPPVPAAPTPHAPTPMPPRTPVVQAPPMVQTPVVQAPSFVQPPALAQQPQTLESTTAFFVSQNTASTASPAAPPPSAPSESNEPKLAMTQLALLVAELTAFPDRTHATLSESGLDAQQWEREWSAWQRRFADQPAERARYEPLVQYYTALRRPGGL